MPDPAPAPAADPAPAPAGDKPWYDGMEPTYVGVLQNRLKPEELSDPKKAVANLVDGYRNAEAKIGYPHDQVVRYDPTNAEVMKAFNERIGVPKEASGYDFSSLKRADGSEVEAGFIDGLRTALHEANVPASAAGQIATAVLKIADSAESAESAEATAKGQAERTALMANWGQHAEANFFIAKQAATKLGVDPSAVDALEGQVGYKAVMEMFLKVGLTMGEDKFVTNQDPNAKGVYSRDGAQARLDELMADAEWGKRLNAGDAQATREFRALTEIIAGVSGTYKAA